ncbi:Cytochrome P450 monooxygenase patI [Lachnellula arida]|uniref:Cytochrome P450 monooxygenase patI n=1 Tax=Lachnellula arida TaxID=1316785 RepID=A0A8T9BM48_9HELO|nr:Cytochrome P450 monooxygenase patI [Lachnellula arida]
MASFPSSLSSSFSSTPLYTYWLYGSLSLLAVAVYKVLSIGKRNPRMPPGPPTVPLLGNALQIPKTGLGKKFRGWADQYGSVFSLTIGPRNIVVVCDRKAANAMLDKKGSIYSDRPFTYVTDYITHGDRLTMENATPAWRERRAIVSRNLSPKILDEKHFRVQEAEAVLFMNNVLRRPERMFDLARLYTASVASTLIWGQRTKDLDSFWYKEFYELMDLWVTIEEAGANPPMDEFPILKWIPGAAWKKRADKCSEMQNTMWTTARSIIDKRRARGDKRDCFIDTKLDEYEAKGFPMSQHAFNNLFGVLLEAGADTTANQILTIILALAKNPEIQKRARKEIDAVCGTDRAPLFSDFKELPYVNCIVKEGMRWRPTFPIDDEYEGMLIPKGTTVFLGAWAIHHDEKLHPNPEEFNPDRYLNHPKLAHEYSVGDFEKRDKYPLFKTIPDSKLTKRNMWRIAAKLLWAFDISEPVDPKTGKVTSLDVNAYNSAVLLCPLPFNVDVVPRSKAHLACIERELESAENFMAQWE